MRAPYIVIFPDSPEVYGWSSKEPAIKQAKKKKPNGTVLFLFNNVDTQELEVRELNLGEEDG